MKSEVLRNRRVMNHSFIYECVCACVLEGHGPRIVTFLVSWLWVSVNYLICLHLYIISILENVINCASWSKCLCVCLCVCVCVWVLVCHASWEHRLAARVHNLLACKAIDPDIAALESMPINVYYEFGSLLTPSLAQWLAECNVMWQNKLT